MACHILVAKEAFKNNPQYQETWLEKPLKTTLQEACYQKTDDRDVVVRMAAAAWYGGSGAMDNYDDPT